MSSITISDPLISLAKPDRRGSLAKSQELKNCDLYDITIFTIALFAFGYRM
jgi:hypothetical protein